MLFRSAAVGTDLNSKVSEWWLENGSWNWELLREHLPLFWAAQVYALPTGNGNNAVPRWKLSIDGTFNTKSTREHLRDKKPKNTLYTLLWNSHMSPSVSIFCWKAINGWIPVDCVMQHRGLTLVSRCQCCQEKESIEHVLIENREVDKTWKHFSNLLSVPKIVGQTLKARLLTWHNSTDYVTEGHIRTIIPAVIAWSSWRARNKAKFENTPINSHQLIGTVMDYIKLSHNAKSMNMKQWKGDLSLACYWGLIIPRPVVKPLLLVYWNKPEMGWVKVNSDAAVTNGSVGIACIVRNDDGRFISCRKKHTNSSGVFQADRKSVV